MLTLVYQTFRMVDFDLKITTLNVNIKIVDLFVLERNNF